MLFGAIGQNFGSFTTLATSNRSSAHTNKGSNMASDQGDFGSRASSTFTTKSTGFISDQESFVDVSKDIELGILPTNKNPVQPTPNNKLTTREKFKQEFHFMRRTGFIKFMQTLLLTVLFSLAIIIPIDLLPLYTDSIDWSLALSTKNNGVLNGTVDYGNGTIALLNDVNLAGSNLTASTCNFITPGDLCTNNSHTFYSIRVPCELVFVVLLLTSMFFAVGVRNGILKVRPGEADRVDRERYFLTKWPRGRAVNQ